MGGRHPGNRFERGAHPGSIPWRLHGPCRLHELPRMHAGGANRCDMGSAFLDLDVTWSRPHGAPRRISPWHSWAASAPNIGGLGDSANARLRIISGVLETRSVTPVAAARLKLAAESRPQRRARAATLGQRSAQRRGGLELGPRRRAVPRGPSVDTACQGRAPP